MSWEPLAASDPIPGDPGAIQAAANGLVEIAEALATAGRRVVSADPGSPWTGLAAQRFDEQRGKLPRALDAVGRRCHGCADALRAYVPRLADAQATAREALVRARMADDDIAAARRGIEAMRAHARAAASDAARWSAANPDDPPRSPAPWTGPDWPARLVAAQAELAAARAQLARAEAARDAAAGQAAADLGRAQRSPDLVAGLWSGVSNLLPPFLRALLRGGGAPDQLSFVVTADGLVLNTREGWQWEALRLAGIDPSTWDPSLGLDRIDAEARAAWELYGTLYDENPEQFLWAGMAKLAGGTFYAGFQDINVLRRALERPGMTVERARELIREWFPHLPRPALGVLLEAAGRSLDGLVADLRFVETTFLRMQRNIFDDLAWQHIAYQQGGLAAMEALHGGGDLRQAHILAWRDIDTGDPARIEAGNARLLRHEQERIIGTDYDRIRDHSPITWALTMGMSVIAESPVPGGRPFRDVVPYRVEATVDIPDRIPLVPDRLVPDRIPGTGIRVPGGGGVYVGTPGQLSAGVDLPLHNVSIFDNRWRWIETDMVPAYLALLESGGAQPLIATPIEELAEGQRLVPLGYEPSP
jgi:hypothetical protein